MKPFAVLLLIVAAGGVAASVQAPRRTVIAVGTVLDGRGHTLRNTRIVVEGDTIAVRHVAFVMKGGTVMRHVVP
jgi:hypothetical protein